MVLCIQEEHNISQEEKYGQKNDHRNAWLGRTANMNTESWKDSCLINWNLRNFRSADIQQQLHFSMDTWQPERTAWRRKNAMIPRNACVCMGIHTHSMWHCHAGRHAYQHEPQ